MPTIRRVDQRPLREALSSRGRMLLPGLPWLTKAYATRLFFGSNAWLAIIVLGLIMLSLYAESVGFDPAHGFFGQNYRSLLAYRQAGLEFVDIIRGETAALDHLGDALSDARLAELKREIAAGEKAGKTEDQALTEANAALASFDDYANKFSTLGNGLNGIASDLGDTVTATRESFKEVEDRKTEKQLYLDAGRKDLAAKVSWQEVDVNAVDQPLKDALPGLATANTQFANDLNAFAALPVPAVGDEMKAALGTFPDQVRALATGVPGYEKALETWTPHQPLAWWAGATDFFFNPRWLTASSWQDYYGILPLLAGSTLISIVALVIAVPLGVGAGVYINQIATPWEQNLIKPAIEFISAIPSVVLGFFGVAILGEFLLKLSHWGFLPPFSERLNVLNAGILLAFMAVPTIFTLTEDAINNVPRAFKEASYALGATRLQTIWRIILPASLSGVISAVLLGFGRVIGETMVVLLCAGNRIALPPMSKGLMIVFEPVHTMTGIIAQELGEVEKNGLHYHALFMVGLLLFLISLAINYFAQQVVRRFKISIG